MKELSEIGLARTSLGPVYGDENLWNGSRENLEQQIVKSTTLGCLNIGLTYCQVKVANGNISVSESLGCLKVVIRSHIVLEFLYG